MLFKHTFVEEKERCNIKNPELVPYSVSLMLPRLVDRIPSQQTVYWQQSRVGFGRDTSLSHIPYFDMFIMLCVCCLCRLGQFCQWEWWSKTNSMWWKFCDYKLKSELKSLYFSNFNPPPFLQTLSNVSSSKKWLTDFIIQVKVYKNRIKKTAIQYRRAFLSSFSSSFIQYCPPKTLLSTPYMSNFFNGKWDSPRT